MNVRKVVTNSSVAENKNKVAIEMGPIVYCVEEIDNGNLDNVAIPVDISLEPKQEKLLSDDVTTLTAKTQKGDLVLIPYYIWSNRGIGKMKVWMPEN